MFAIYSGAFWNSTQLPETNAFTQHRSRIDNSCNRGHLVPSRGLKVAGPDPGSTWAVDLTGDLTGLVAAA